MGEKAETKNVLPIRSAAAPPAKPAPPTNTGTTDTVELTPRIVNGWLTPSFQRPLRKTKVFFDVVNYIKDESIIPDVLTLAIHRGKTYLLDGHHRREAFLVSGLETVYAEIRTIYYTDAEGDDKKDGGDGKMGADYIRINGKIQTQKSDHSLKAFEESSEELQYIRKKCPFVGYDQIRRGPKTPMVSMSAVLKMWVGSSTEVPAIPTTSSLEMARGFSQNDAQELSVFLNMVHDAWGRDREYQQLWATLNMTMCMWIYRRLILSPAKDSRSTPFSVALFSKCLMELSSDAKYLAWLPNRPLRPNDRGPCYGRIKAIFARRVERETGRKPKLPQPAWSNG